MTPYVHPLKDAKVTKHLALMAAQNALDSGAPEEVQQETFRAHLLAAQTGLELRDYFAAHAMAACLADSQAAKIAARHGVDAFDWIAASAYKVADAMLEARDA